MVNNRQGLALVMVMVYALVLTILGTAILGVAISEYRMETAHRDVVKAYYIAEAGMEKAICEITQTEKILPSVLENKKWEMGPEDFSLVEPGIQAGFTVTVEYVDLKEEIFVEEGETIVLYKSIYGIGLKSVAAYKGAPAELKAIILVEDYEDMDRENKVEVQNWRQTRGVYGEDKKLYGGCSNTPAL
ncbi:MAG TPA: pilus assembly PilX N-terminal domain-containing protein [Clostridia bacterium]|jgi:hypothetical protein|nr:pilus assembly PilX N-terminal domain-containing protein [Clostridia bacterium]